MNAFRLAWASLGVIGVWGAFVVGQGTAVAQNGATIFLPMVSNHYDPTWEWQELETVTLSSQVPVGVIDTQSRLHLFWQATSTPYYIYHTYQTAEGWSPAVPVAESLGRSELLYLPLLAPDGSIHLVWHNNLGFGIENPHRLLYAQFREGAWQAEQELYRANAPGFGGTPGLQGMVHLDQQANIYVTILIPGIFSSSTIHLKQTSNGWLSSGVIDPGHNSSVIWPDMQGGIHFYNFRQNTPNNLQYSYWLHGAFGPRGQVPAEISGRDTQLDGYNNLHTYRTGTVPVQGGSVTGLYYQCLQPNLSWAVPHEQVLSGNNNVANVQKGANIRGEFALGWQEGQAALYRFSLSTGCQSVRQGDIPFLNAQNTQLATVVLGQNPVSACFVSKRKFSSDYTAVCGYTR